MVTSTVCDRDVHLRARGPKRILAIDGGGIRGIISLAYLERLEALLHERHGSCLRLCDFFDLIGGTSTGSIIATGLALGMEVSELIEIYLVLAEKGFKGSRWHGGFIIPKFRTAPLVELIQSQVGTITLGSENIRTGLAIVAKRIDTGSIWVFHNNPRGPYFDPTAMSPNVVPNKDLPLLKLIRASTAAPTFFAPEWIEVAKGVSGVFVDGGVSPHNNPALLLFMLATISGYGLHWPTGADRLMVVSLGTGHRPTTPADLPPHGAPSGALAILALRSLMNDSNWLAQTMLQWLGNSPTLWQIDGEMGDLSQDQLGDRALLHYLRYDLWLQGGWLERELDVTLDEPQLQALAMMDRPKHVQDLLNLGRIAAARQIRPEHLPDEFHQLAIPLKSGASPLGPTT